MRKIGYARVSSATHNLDRQIAALRAERCDAIFHEKASGRAIKGRPELEKAIDELGIGDVLVVAEWDRATRSMMDGVAIIERVHRREALIKVLDKPHLDLSTPLGRGFNAFLSAMAEDERQRIHKRACEGRLGHCDAAPWNVISRQGKPVALVDWEAAGPVDRLTELAMAAWNNAQLYDDDVAEMNSLPAAGHRLRQVRIFVDAYGLPVKDRHRLGDRIIEFAGQSAANEVIEQNITPETEHAPRVWGIAWQTRSVAWLIRNRNALKAALA
jgi:Resolvase, N terminal domain/Phosphotransferase enzyme family